MMKDVSRLFFIVFFVFFACELSFASIIPKEEHVVWHDGEADYFALSESGILYSVHKNQYHKLYRVKDRELVESIFLMIQENGFTTLPPPKNKEEIIKVDKEHYRHIELRRHGRKYETYWTEKDNRVEPEYLTQVIQKLMKLV